MIVLFILALVFSVSHSANCPDENPDLKPWSAASSWTSGVPATGSKVTIGSNMKILLDTDVILDSLTISNGGLLVWASNKALHMQTNYTLLRDGGEMHIGSPQCLRSFDFPAKIELLGEYGVGEEVPSFGQKFIGVAAGGVLELHGSVNDSPPWTKLAKTMSPLGAVKQTVWQRGMSIALFDGKSGQFLSRRSFDTYDFINFTIGVEFLAALKDNTIPTGTIMLIMSHDSAETQIKNNQTIWDAGVALGCMKMSEIAFRSGYVCMTRKGDQNATVERIWKFINDTDPNNAIGTGVVSGDFNLGSIAGVDTVLTLQAQSSYSNSFFQSSSASDTVATLAENVNWPAGSTVVVGTSDFEPKQSEEFTIVECASCSKNQIRLRGKLKYMHYGENLDCVDERAEVGLLTRPIQIFGKMKSSCYGNSTICDLTKYSIVDDSGATVEVSDDLFGGHVKMISGFKSAHIQGVELYNVGQQFHLGAYPLHWHLCGDVDILGGYNPRTYAINNAVHNSFSRCFTIHATNGLLLRDNIGYNALGHCFFLEDGVEERNILDGNLALLTRFGTLLPTDRSYQICTALSPVGGGCDALSNYWITNPRNILINNVAGGTEGYNGVGIWYIFPEWPTGVIGDTLTTRTDANRITYFTLTRFEHNLVHSSQIGFMADNGVQWRKDSDPQYLGKTGMRWKPKVDPAGGWGSQSLPAVFHKLVAYKNTFRGAWFRGGDLHVIDSTFADNGRGITMATDGLGPNEPGTRETVNNTLFVGWTENVGTPSHGRPTTTTPDGRVRTTPGWSFPVAGYEIYDGPLHVHHCYFKKFDKPEGYGANSSALGFLLGNNWNTGTNCKVTELSFGPNTGVSRMFVYGDLDGDLNSIVRDEDGSISGIRNAFITRNHGYFVTKNCFVQPTWDMATCKDEYAQIFIFDSNGLGIQVIREDSNYVYQLRSTAAAFHLPVRLSQGIAIGFNNFNFGTPIDSPTPPNFRIDLGNFPVGGWARVGFCFPAGTTFSIEYRYSWLVTVTLNQSTTYNDMMNSNNMSSYYWDETAHVLFLKLVSIRGTTWWNYWAGPGDARESVVIKATVTSPGVSGNECLPLVMAKYQKPEVDCAGTPGGTGVIDACGVCKGSAKAPCTANQQSFTICHDDYITTRNSLRQANDYKIVYPVFVDSQYRVISNRTDDGVLTLTTLSGKLMLSVQTITTDIIKFTIKGQTIGWVAVGIPETPGLMGGTDAVIGKIVGGTVDVKDYHIGRTQAAGCPDGVCIDTQQDIFNVSGSEADGWTIISFYRYRKTSDYLNDLPIGAPGTVQHLTLAMGPSDDLVYHGQNRVPVEIVVPQIGISISFYNNTNVTGTPIFSGRQDNFNFDLADKGPNMGNNPYDYYSARATGWLYPAHETGTQNYTFYVMPDDGARFYINGQLVVDAWTNSINQYVSGTFALTAGSVYEVMVEWYEGVGNARLVVQWESQGVPRQLLPSGSLVNPPFDECSSGVSGCSAHSTCTDTRNYYVCTCVAPYVGDGYTCYDPTQPVPTFPPPTSSNPTTGAPVDKSTSDGALSQSAIIGIGVGAGAVVLIVVIVVIVVLAKKKGTESF